MKHIETIEALIKTLLENHFHALVIQSPPGWGKSTAISQALGRMHLPFIAHGSYSTPLHLYNTLCDHADQIHVLDDCAGLFGDVRAMSVLKAATWASSQESKDGVPLTSRRITWGSSSEKVGRPFCDFRGKLILVSNTLPAGQETLAFLTRCLSFRIQLTDPQIKELLLSAARSKEHFPETGTSLEVAEFLVSEMTGADLKQLNLRTLQMGYALARSNPQGWRELLLDLLPRAQGQAQDLIARLATSSLSVKAQEARFRSVTGKSRRTFYEHKKKLGLSRAYRIDL